MLKDTPTKTQRLKEHEANRLGFLWCLGAVVAMVSAEFAIVSRQRAAKKALHLYRSDQK